MHDMDMKRDFDALERKLPPLPQFLNVSLRNHPRVAKKPLDRLLENLRFAKAKPYIPKKARLLDIGAGDGAFLRSLSGHIQSGVGIDPILTKPVELGETCRLVPGYFPRDIIACGSPFDVITLLAVVEHIPVPELYDVAKACWDSLKLNGRLIITVPHPRVDKILDILKNLRIIEGLSLEEHHGFDPEQLPEIFNRWTLLKKERWEFGCNYLFIFGKS